MVASNYTACWDQGVKAEDAFRTAMEDQGWTVKKASRLQDMNEHIDFIIRKVDTATRKCIEYAVDVKAAKRTKRSDTACQDELIWLELHGVREHDDGWIFGSKADIIAFQNTDGSFLFVTIDEIKSFIEQHVDQTQSADNPTAAVGKLYRRRDACAQQQPNPLQKHHHDVLTLVRRKELADVTMRTSLPLLRGVAGAPC